MFNDIDGEYNIELPCRRCKIAYPISNNVHAATASDGCCRSRELHAELVKARVECGEECAVVTPDLQNIRGSKCMCIQQALEGISVAAHALRGPNVVRCLHVQSFVLGFASRRSAVDEVATATPCQKASRPGRIQLATCKDLTRRQRSENGHLRVAALATWKLRQRRSIVEQFASPLRLSMPVRVSGEITQPPIRCGRRRSLQAHEVIRQAQIRPAHLPLPGRHP